MRAMPLALAAATAATAIAGCGGTTGRHTTSVVLRRGTLSGPGLPESRSEREAKERYARELSEIHGGKVAPGP